MSGKGGADLARYRAGGKLTRGQAIYARCCECMGDYADGRADCEIPGCPLYPWQPYRAKGRKTAEKAPDLDDHPSTRRMVHEKPSASPPTTKDSILGAGG